MVWHGTARHGRAVGAGPGMVWSGAARYGKAGPVTAPEPTEPLTPHAAALRLAACGFRIVPIKEGGKHPPLADWWHAATSDPAMIDHWFTGLYKTAGVGIAMGDNCVFALDVDITDGKLGQETLRDLEDSYSELPETVEQQTGSGGRHLLYRAPEGVEIRNDAGRKLGPGLDIRGVGGQVVVAPTIHPNGQPYQWLWDSAPWERSVADAPGWLIALLTREDEAWASASASTTTVADGSTGNALAGSPATRSRDAGSSSTTTAPTHASPRPGDRFNQQTTWPTLLENDGWTRARDGHEGEQRWTRPGKTTRDGISATVGYKGSDVLKVFTSSVPLLEQDRTYDRFGYWAATRHHGNIAMAAIALNAEHRQNLADLIGTWKSTRADDQHLREETAGHGEEQRDDSPGLAKWRIDWPTLWNKDHHEAEWTLEPLLAQGRGHALYATAKSGKSLLLLAIAASLATGQPFLDQPTGPPRHVVYLDYEMNETDLVERLDSMGYGPDTNLEHLHYILLPTIGGLDTTEGAQYVIEAVDHWHPELVIIDTTARAVEGEENSADTFRAFYRHLGLALKQRNITYVRADHAGKDGEKGQRGSSAKNDDVDVVWWYQRTEDGATLYAKYRRMAWVPEKVDLKIVDHPHLTYRTGLQSVPAGMTDALTQIETLDLPRGISRRKAREAGVTASTDALRAALKLWKTPQVHPQVHSLEDLIGSPNRSTRSTGETAGQDPRSTVRSTQVHPSSQVDLGPLSLERGPVQASPGPDQTFNPFD